jgi:outer membrane receptor for ferrienterochelin and colicin
VSSTKLAAEEIRRFPGGFEDIVRTVATLPGVAVVNEGGRNDLLVRGGGPSENLYLINNIEVPNINHFGSQGSSSGALSFVNLDFIDRVEFSTGGFGARYGDKMSSVLSLGIRPGRSDRIGGEATISATQFGLNLEGPRSFRNKK